MSLGEYVGSGSGTTRLLLHLNGNSTDSSGNGNNGTDSNITYVNGRLVKYASFNGTNGYIQVPDHSSLNITDAITVSLWFNTFRETGGAYILDKFSYGITPEAREYEIIIRSSNRKIGFHIQLTTGLITIYDTEACKANIWKYVTGVYDGSAVKLYVDGVLKTQVNATGQINNPNPKSDLGLGTYINVTTPPPSTIFGGYIDEVIIESRAWSHSEIIKYYTNTLGRYGII